MSRSLEPVIDVLARRRVDPDLLTMAAVPVGLAAAGCLLLSPSESWLLMLVPILAALRLVLNVLDGAVARRASRTHPRGELYNELCDRLSDVAFLAPVAFLPGAHQPTVLLGVVGALFASFVGLASRAAGSERIYRGILSKPGRMVLVSLFAVAVFVVGRSAWGPFGPLLLIGTVLTALERAVIAIRRLA